MREKLIWYTVLVIMILLVMHSHCRAEVIIALRYDDYSAISNFDIEKRLMEILRKYQLPHTFGVIPNASIDPRDIHNTEFAPLESSEIRVKTLRDGAQSGLLEVALHGYTHQTCNPSRFSEFHGLPYEVQRKKIVQGKSTLEKLIGMPISTFIPPWNAYDQSTVAACSSEGIKIFSAGYNPSHTCVDPDMIFLPRRTGLENLDQLAQSAADIEFSHPLFIIVLSHSSDFTESGSDLSFTNLSEFEAMISRCNNMPNVKFMNLRQIAQTFPTQLRDDRYGALLRFKRNWRLIHGIPVVGGAIGNRTLGKYSQGVYWTKAVYQDLSGKLFRRFLVLYSLAAILAAILALLLSILYCYAIRAKGVSRAFVVGPIIFCSAAVVFVILANFSGILGNPGLGVRDQLILIFLITCDIALVVTMHLTGKLNIVCGADRAEC